MLADAALKLLPSFWKRLVSDHGLPPRPWVVPLSYGTLSMESTLAISHGQGGNLSLREQRFELHYPAVPVDARDRADLPASMVQGIPPCEHLIPASYHITIGQHIAYHREQLAREIGDFPREQHRKVVLAACLAELRQEKEHREAIQLSLEALEKLDDPDDFGPYGIGSEAMRILFDFAMTAGDDEAVLKGLQVWDTIQKTTPCSSSRSSSTCLATRQNVYAVCAPFR